MSLIAAQYDVLKYTVFREVTIRMGVIFYKSLHNLKFTMSLMLFNAENVKNANYRKSILYRRILLDLQWWQICLI